MSSIRGRSKKPIKSYFSDTPTESAQSDNDEGWTAVPQRRSRPTEQNRPTEHGSRQMFDNPGRSSPCPEQEMNAAIAERVTSRQQQFEPPSSLPTSCPNKASSDIRAYIEESRLPVNTSSWLSKPEIPSSDEVLDVNQDYGDVVPMFQNKVEGGWESKENYLESHFELLREDSILPLRQAIGSIRTDPWHPEAVYGTSVGLYENVRILSVKFANRGLAVRVQFSLRRLGKQVRWEQSKRLLTGSLVALTTEDDCFETMCTMATVASRDHLLLGQNPPQIELFFARAEELQIDPGMSFLMVEERSSFLEASRYTLRALQKLMREPFPLQEHLVDVKKDVSSPNHVNENPFMDLRTVFAAEFPERIDILSDWPEDLSTELDKTQLQALQRMLTKRLAIVQGPPGTGKTHVSVVALKAWLQNMVNGPPIIIACHTNHALDQLLRHVARFEPEFARLGGRSKDQDVIKPRTLYELRQLEKFGPVHGGLKMPAIYEQKSLGREMREILSPLQQDYLSPKCLQQIGLLNEQQVDSLENPTLKWISHGSTAEENDQNSMEHWLGTFSERVIRHIAPDDFGFDFEEADLEWEQLKEIEAESGLKYDENDIENLPGTVFELDEKYKGKEPVFMEDADIRALLDKTADLHRINKKDRGMVYNYLKRQFKNSVLPQIREIAKRYQDASIRRTAGYWEEDVMLLKKQKIIGMTTTGFSKYRALVSALKPKIVLIEEAAETLEAPVAVTCIPSLEHLVLVGDHQQLRPHCQVRDYEDEPFNLNMSLFERLVKNGVEYDTLRRQRRMIPEIRRLLQPIYGDLIADHQIVKDPEYRPPVPGMGGIDSFFFTHEWEESRDSTMSSCNWEEAEMVIKFFEYLYLNGIAPENITVLTFYNGQRKLLLQKLRMNPNFQGAGRYFKVVTVDSYQGEENDIVILSLARSNAYGSVGFLRVKNRVCVALSRARRGFYLFGNGELFACESKIWAQVITILAGKAGVKVRTGPQMRLGYHLPLTCENHGRKTFIAEPDDFECLHGGCELKCKEKLPCGHYCHLRCHPFPHESVVCARPCARTLKCGHICQEVCSDPCQCHQCVRVTGNSTAIIKPGTHLGFGKKKENAVPSSSTAPPQPKSPSSPMRSSVYRIAAANHEPPQTTGNYEAAWQAYPANVRQHDAEFAAQRRQEAAEERQRRADAAADEAVRDRLERDIELLVLGDRDAVGPSQPQTPDSPAVAPSSTRAANRVYHGNPSASGRVKYTDTYAPGRCVVSRGPTGGPTGRDDSASGNRRKDMSNSQSEKSLLD